MVASARPNAVSRIVRMASMRALRHLAYTRENVTQVEDNRTGLEQFCPHKPWPKQRAFLSLACEESFYGGAAGGGKSDTLLMAALQYVHVPGYSALILRRDFARLSLPGAIMDRAREWLEGTQAKWNESRKLFTFPSGATLQFGYIDNPADRYRYASSEYQFIGWDELTEFTLPDDESNPYLFLFSRLRQTKDIGVPLRVCSASNPGNIGHHWAKRRFITEAALQALRDGVASTVLEGPEGRAFIPALIADNPALDEEGYLHSLRHLPPVTRARLMTGNWDVAESLVIPAEWFGRYKLRGDLISLASDSTKLADVRSCRRFATIDTAGTSRDKADESRGKPPSWSVVGIWDYCPANDWLLLRHVWRDRVDWPTLKMRSAQVIREWSVPQVRIENAHVGQPLATELQASVSATVKLVGPSLPGMHDGYRGAKLERAIASGLLSRLQAGKVLLPADCDDDWLKAYELELTSWTGLPDETCDQIDMSSYASWEVHKSGKTW